MASYRMNDVLNRPKDAQPPLFPYNVPELHARYWKREMAPRAVAKPDIMISSYWYQHYGALCPHEMSKSSTFSEKRNTNSGPPNGTPAAPEYPGFAIATPLVTSIYEVRKVPTERDVAYGETRDADWLEERPRLICEIPTDEDTMFQPISLGEQPPLLAWGYKLNHGGEEWASSTPSSIVAVLRGTVIECIDAKQGKLFSSFDIANEMERLQIGMQEDPQSICAAGSSVFVFTCNSGFAAHDVSQRGFAIKPTRPPGLDDHHRNLASSVCPIGGPSSVIHIPHSEGSKSLCIAPFIATGHRDGVIRVWKTSSKTILSVIQTHGPLQVIRSLSMSHDESSLLVQKSGDFEEPVHENEPAETSVLSAEEIERIPWIFATVKQGLSKIGKVWDINDSIRNEIEKYSVEGGERLDSEIADMWQEYRSKELDCSSVDTIRQSHFADMCAAVSMDLSKWVKRSIMSSTCGQIIVLDVNRVISSGRSLSFTVDGDLCDIFDRHNCFSSSLLPVRSLILPQLFDSWNMAMPVEWLPDSMHIAIGSRREDFPIQLWHVARELDSDRGGGNVFEPCGFKFSEALSFNFNVCEGDPKDSHSPPSSSYCLSLSVMPTASSASVGVIECRSDRVVLYGRGLCNWLETTRNRNIMRHLRISGNLDEYAIMQKTLVKLNRKPGDLKVGQSVPRVRYSSSSVHASNTDEQDWPTVTTSISERVKSYLGTNVCGVELIGNPDSCRIPIDLCSRYIGLAQSIVSRIHIVQNLDRVCHSEVVLDDSEYESEDEGWRTAATTDHQGRHCSWEQGYHTQQIFLCITCMRRQMFSQARRRREELEQRPTKSRRTEQPAGNAGEHDPFDDYRAFPLAFCERCIHQCHQLRGHAVVNIGLKQNIRCDCGTRRMQVCMDGLDPNTCENYDTYTNSDHYCTLTPEKDELRDDDTSAVNYPHFRGNPRNAYDHSYYLRYCYCNGVEERPMVQCCFCDDWFHSTCVHDQQHTEIDVTMEPFLSCYFVCHDCRRSCLPFIDTYHVVPASRAVEDIVASLANADADQRPSDPVEVGIALDKGLLLWPEWRSKLTNADTESLEQSTQYPERFSCHRCIDDIVHRGMLVASVEEQLREEGNQETDHRMFTLSNDEIERLRSSDSPVTSASVDPVRIMRQLASSSSAAEESDAIASAYRNVCVNSIANLVREAQREGRDTITEEDVSRNFQRLRRSGS